MAVLAPQDWHPPRDHAMDLPSSTSSIPRQRSSPPSDHAPSQSPPVVPQQQPQQQQPQPQQPYPYPVQQQPQGGWTPSIAAQPFYPSFYQNQPQQPQYNLHSSPGHIPPQNPYFDPTANAQLAQWAYQQMMYAQQAQQMGHISRNGPNGAPEYFPQSQLVGFTGFPNSGTPPPPHANQNHPAHNFGQHRSSSADQQQYSGFHPYRRPNNRQVSHSQDSDWRSQLPGTFQPPYGRADAASSSTSVNSQNNYTGPGTRTGPRQRTDSNQTSSSNDHSGSHNNGSARSRGTLSDPSRPRAGSNSSSSSNPQHARPPPHHRSGSSSSTTSSSSAAPRPSVASTTSSVTTSSATSATGNPKVRPVRPSPLSQGNFTAAEKRMSRDDSDIAAMMESSPHASALRSGGLKGRLRRALSLNASQTLSEERDNEGEDDDASIKASALGRTPAPSAKASGSKAPVSKPVPGLNDDAESAATIQTKKKGRAASLFNSRLNASTDNISLSSTVSSASVMIRKLGSMGNLARRNSLAGITSLFKDKKNKDKDGEGGSSGKKDKKKRGAKGDAAEASISLATAELDRSSDWTAGAGEMTGLSPAAKLARQHTLKSNAEAAARAKAAQEAQTAAQKQGANASPVPETWEKNTATRSPAKASGLFKVNEDGTRSVVEDNDSGSESGEGTYDGHQQDRSIGEGWDDDEDWGEGDDQDVTIRVGMERTNISDETDETEEWATNIRRSVERVRLPKKGILKHAATYDQASYLVEGNNPTFPSRARANSDNSHPTQNQELGPLARIPSPDPDHIDGLSRHPSHSSQHRDSPGKTSASLVPTAPFLPALSFETSGGLDIESPQQVDSGRSSPNPPEKAQPVFNHPSFNSSAPTLSTMTNPTPPTLTHRSATVPAKRLVFANNLSVYDTFSSSVYDRRSEPATWSRLTPALAQRIKEELNSYKMEEMEVHAASRIHTQFFV